MATTPLLLLALLPERAARAPQAAGPAVERGLVLHYACPFDASVHRADAAPARRVEAGLRRMNQLEIPNPGPPPGTPPSNPTRSCAPAAGAER